MHKIYKGVAASLAALILSAPGLALAETGPNLGLTAEVQAQVTALLTQIKAFQEQIRVLVGSSTPRLGEFMKGGGMPPGQMGKFACIALHRNLRQGDEGEDVKKLQEMLAEDPENEFNASATGFFGPLTMRAMMKFQMRMGIASSTDGSVGPLTRGFFQRRCGLGLDGQQGEGKGMMISDEMKQKMMPMDGMHMGMVHGTITASNSSSITVQVADNSSVTVNITAGTVIKIFSGPPNPPMAGTAADLVVGKKVMVGGAKNADGTISAQHIAVGEMLPLMKPDFDPAGPKPPLPPNSGPGGHGSIVPGVNSGPGGGNN